jgi:ABC-type amino acid transport substrate-binding protein
MHIYSIILTNLSIFPHSPENGDKNMKNIILGLCVILINFGAAAETTYERVLRTGVIKCGYILWAPWFDIDIATQKPSGINYEYAEALARNLNLKIEWTMEVLPGSQIESLRTGKIDAICSADGPMVPSTIKYVSYSTPMFYHPMFLYARSDDARFDRDWLSSINSNTIKISVIDGDVSAQTAAIFFPKAQIIAIPQLGTPSQMMMDVAAKKADIVINEPLSMEEYFKNNQGKLKMITHNPIAVIPNTLSVLRSEENITFLDMLNQAIQNMKDSGEEKMILERYQPKPDKKRNFYLSSMPFVQ